MKLISREYDPHTGITEESWYDDQTNRLTLRRLQDVERNLWHNKELFNSFTGKKPSYQDSDGLHKVASIPFVIIEKWLREDGFDWYNSTDAERRAKLNHRDNRHLLVRPGKL